MQQGVFVVIFAIILDVTSVETGSKMLQKKFLLDGQDNTCDFNANTLCSWRNVRDLKAGEVSDDFDWALYAGSTPTDDTGPSVDHTTGTDKGTYAFIESSAPRALGERAWMESPEIRALGQSVVCFRFWYHKFGENMGNLSVYQHHNGPRPGILVWSDVTEHGDRWLSAQVPLLANVNFRIILEGVIGDGYLGDIAVDDVSVRNEYCLVSPPEASRSNVTPPPVTSVPSPATTTPVNPCSPSPCVRGSCYIGNGDSPTFFCLCPSGYNGLYCETGVTTTAATTTPFQTTTTTVTTIHVNPCFPSPCVRGSCFTGSGNDLTFFCLCPSGFTGVHCETVISTTIATTTPIQTTTTTVPTSPADPCSPSPCVRGSCFIGNGNNPTFFCLCPNGYNGLYCETEINPCSPSPCVRGTCVKGSGNNPTYFCLCPSEFTGLHCETVITTTTATTTTAIQTTTTTDCKDTIDRCWEYPETSCKAPYEEWAKQNCPNRCGYCIGPSTPTPPCIDAIPDCISYNRSVCTNTIYRDWAMKNCRAFCRMTLCTPAQIEAFDRMTTTIAPENCVDKVNCQQQVSNVCSYEAWSRDNCPRHCGYCVGIPTPPPVCEDKSDICNQYASSTCTAPEYRLWVDLNCKKFCGRCV